MTDPTLPVRKAVVDALTLASIGVPVGSRMPDNSEPPFVTVDGISFTGPITKDGRDWDVVVDVTVVAPARTYAVAETISAAVADALSGAQLSAPGFSFSTIHLQSSTPETSEDRLLYFIRHSYALMASAT
jgi:hypothetical protein